MTGTDRTTEQGTMPANDDEVQGVSGGAAPAEPMPDAADATAARLAEAEAEIARLKQDYLRALAETENVRKRAARERQEAGQYAITAFARDMLSVADNLERALASVDAAARLADSALGSLCSGIEMTGRELHAVFDRYGIKSIVAAGQPFDPHVHEALFELPDASVPQGTIVQVLQSGYTLHERTLRPARVGVARGGPKPGATAEPQAASAEPEVPPGVAADEGPLQVPPREAGDAYRQPSDAPADGTGTQINEKL